MSHSNCKKFIQKKCIKTNEKKRLDVGNTTKKDSIFFAYRIELNSMANND